MPSSNAEIVRDLYLATNERDFPRALHHHAENAELVVSDPKFLGGGIHRGREAIRLWFSDWMGTFQPDFRFDIDELAEIGDSVLVVATMHGRGKASGAAATGEVVWTYRLRDGEIVHLQLHRSRPAALEALETARRGD